MSEPTPNAPSLIEALQQTFASDLPASSFATRLIELARALVTCPWAVVLDLMDAEVEIRLGQMPDPVSPAVTAAAKTLLGADEDGPDVVVLPEALIARVAMPDGARAALALGRSAGGQIAQSLSYERLALLSVLSFAQNAHPDHTLQADLIARVRAVASEPTSEGLQALADVLSRHMSADYAAIALASAGRINELKISGQDGAAKRASLPDRLRTEMRATLRAHGTSGDRIFAPTTAGGDSGLVFHVEGAQRNPSGAQLAAAIYGVSGARAHQRRWTGARFVKLGVWALVLIGVCLVPIPDRVEIPAMVEAAERRVVTAPFTGRLDTIAVSDSAAVEQGTPLVQLDTDAIDLDLIEVRAEMARALMDREAARAARSAADLRHAELEVERLEARTTRLSHQLRDAALVAPINGLVIAPDLIEQLGTTVRQGDVLMEIADPRLLRLRLSIPDETLALVDTGSVGQFRPDYDPTLSYTAEIADISPAVSIRDDVPILDGHADLEADVAGLRPGLNGLMALERTWQPAALFVYEAIRDWVLLRVWF